MVDTHKDCKKLNLLVTLMGTNISCCRKNTENQKLSETNEISNANNPPPSDLFFFQPSLYTIANTSDFFSLPESGHENVVSDDEDKAFTK